MANLIATGGYSIKNVFDGDPAKSYRIQLDNTAIIKDNLTQSVTPDGLTVDGLEISGFSDPVAFLGYFKIYRRSDAGITIQDYEQLLAEGKIVPESTYIIGQTSNLLVEVYRSTQAESTVVYDVEYASDTTGIYVYLYKDAGFQTLLDLATVPVSPNGVKVKTITIEYKMDDQGVTPPTTGWAATIPTPVPGKYLWTRATTLFDDGKESIAYSVSGHGATGVDARAVQLSASTTVIAYDALGSNPSLATLPLTAVSVNTAGTPYYEFLVNGSSKQNGTGSSYTYAVPSTYSGATAAIEVRLREGGTTGAVLAKDLLTVTQIKPGQDAYTVVLSNESHTFPGTETAAIAGSTSTKIIAFKGVTQVPVTINTITGHPTGMTTSIVNNNSVNARVDITVTTGLVALGGELVVPVKVDNKDFEKKFTFSVARKGNDGYMVALTNEAHVFGGDVNGATGETISTQVMAYRGGTQLPVKFGTITAPTGMTITKVGDDTTNASLTIAVTSGLTPLKGTVTIPMTIDNKSMSKAFSYSTALKGADGRAITTVDVEFASSTSNSTAPTTGWLTSAPIWRQGYYMWSRTKTTYSVGDPTYSAATCISGAQGSDGRSITSVVEEYNLSTSSTAANGTWVSSSPAWEDGKYIWTRTTVNYSSGSPSVFGPTNITGAKGGTGSAGADAYSINLSKESYVFAGGTTNAIDGQSTTIDITALKGIAATNVTISSITGAPTGMTTSISGSGTAKATVTVSVASSMTSASGSLVIPVIVGGKSFTRNFTYGLALKGTTGSTGAAGSDGVAVLMSNESHVFAGNTAGADAGSVTSNIVAYKGGTLIPVTVGSITTPTGLSVSVSGNGGTAVSLTISVTTDLTPLAGTVTIPLTVDGKSFTKIFSYSTSLKGANGSNGQDAVSINLSKESYIFPGSTSAALASNTSFAVSALKGGTAIPVTVTSSGTPTGMTVTITGSGTNTATVAVAVTTAMNTVSGSFTLTITADSKTFTRSFAYAIALTGDDGLPGPAGTSSYTHIAYATNATGTTGFSLIDSVGKTYIGMYVDNILADSDDWTKYKWTLIKGADGAQGIQGPAGSNGLTPYFHVAYATNATGTDGFSKTDPTARPYMGTYSDYVAADSDNPADYTWSLIQGPAGTPATPLYTWVRYADTPTTGMSADSTNKKYMGIATNKTSQTPSSNYADYTWTLLFDQSVIGTNLLVRNGEWENQLLDADGSMLGTDNICVSAVDIDVIEGQVYTFTKRTTTLDLDGGYWRVATYNASGDFVSRWIASSNEHQWIVPAGIKTIRASYPIDCFPKIEKGPRGTEWVPASGDVDKKIYEAITAMGAQIDHTQASILQTVYETYVNKSTLSEYQTQVASAISQTADQVAIKFSEATSQINSVDGKLVEKFTTMENHITFDAADGSINLRAFSSDPSINTDISLKILRDRITFYQGDNPVAYFSENKLYITNGEFLNSLRLGNFAFTPRTNGNLSFGKVV